MLYVPADKEKMLIKAAGYPCDSLIIDLEDAVSPDLKALARENVKHHTGALSQTKEIFVRVNDVDSSFFEKDVQTVSMLPVDGIVLPKADPRAVIMANEALDKLDTANRLVVIPLVETARGLVNITQTISKSDRVVGIQFGAEDYTKDMDVVRTVDGGEIAFARHLIGLHCMAAGVQAIDTPYVDYIDQAGLIADCESAKAAGMKAKTCIHPAQIATVNQAFSPSDAEVIWAIEVFEAMRIPDNQGKSAFSLHGKMVDTPIMERAKCILQKVGRLP